MEVPAWPQDAAIYSVATYAGLRLGEIGRLRDIDIDFPKRLIHVRGAFTQKTEDAPKSGKGRAVPMIDQVFGTLAVQVFPLSDVKADMGHADIATTMIYVHYVPSTTPPPSSP